MRNCSLLLKLLCDKRMCAPVKTMLLLGKMPLFGKLGEMPHALRENTPIRVYTVRLLFTIEIMLVLDGR